MSSNLTTEPLAISGNHIEITQLTGVGDVVLDFMPNKQVYCLIGENGVGKTKCIEALFTSYVFFNQAFSSILGEIDWNNTKIFEKIAFYKGALSIPLESEKNPKPDDGSTYYFDLGKQIKKEEFIDKLNVPVVLVSTLSRGLIKPNDNVDSKIGSNAERLENHICRIDSWLYREPDGRNSLDIDTKEWIIQRAQSSNRFQKKEDNREAEIATLLKLLNSIDSQYDAEFLEITGEDEVYIKINGQKTELSELSSGFSSLLKIIQLIIASYSSFTNETDISQVKGVVFIDEIESHLHTKWQAHIIPKLKQLFPNTTFYITTHSPIVISQLEHGEAYELYRDEADKKVKTRLIDNPNSSAFIDLLKDAFDIDINRLKLERDNAPNQKNAKKMLSDLLAKRINEIQESKEV